jgi:hypothetical protein
VCGRGGPAGRTHSRDPGLQWAHETNLDATGQGSWREIPLFSSPLGDDATSGTTGSAPNDPASWTARGTFCSVREGLLAQQLHSESTGEIRTRSPDDPDGPTVVVKLQVSKGAEPRFYTFLLPFSYLILVQCPTETNKHDRLSA